MPTGVHVLLSSSAAFIVHANIHLVFVHAPYLLLAHPTALQTGMPDIERLARKLEVQRASLADLCQLYRASSVLPRLEEALRCHEVWHAVFYILAVGALVFVFVQWCFVFGFATP
jgi:hypothetical protein